MQVPVSILRLPADQVDAVQESLVDIYRQTFCLPPYEETEKDVGMFADRLLDDAEQPGFRCYIACCMFENQIVGFIYGTPWQAHSAWHGCIASACGDSMRRRWLEPSFVVTELAVVPHARGRRLGRRLHDALLASAPQPRAILTTPQLEIPANQLYLSAGWRVLRANFQCDHMKQPYVVMGLKRCAA